MEQLNVGALPVCDGGRVIGMVTDRDIVLRAVASGRDPVHTTVRDVQSSDAVVAFEDQPIAEVARLMREHQIRRIPVVREGRKLVGIVSIGDLAVRTDDDERTEQVLEDISQPPSGSAGDARRRGPFKSANGKGMIMNNRYGTMGDEREGFYGKDLLKFD
jgi:CBS-domain-containing membrane protein